MTKFYTTLKFSLFFLLIGIAVSCKDDAVDLTPDTTNTIAYNGKTYNLIDGLILDYGAFGLGTTPTHYNYDLAVVNGEIDLVEGVYDPDNASAGIWAELYSPGTEAFKTGTFKYMAEASMTESAIASKHFFMNASFMSVESTGYVHLYVTSGTVKVTGTAKNYLVQYDVVLEDGKTLKGSFKSEFKYNDYR